MDVIVKYYVLEKITGRLEKLTYGLSKEHCDPSLVAKKVLEGCYDGIHTDQLDPWAAVIANLMAQHIHHDYDTLAARIAVSNLHKNTNESFSETIKIIHDEESGLIADDVYKIVIDNTAFLDREIVHSRDFNYDYSTFENLPLLKVKGKVVERPQYMVMRAAVQTHKDNIESVVKTYHSVSWGLLWNVSNKMKRGRTCMSWEKKNEGGLWKKEKTTDSRTRIAEVEYSHPYANSESVLPETVRINHLKIIESMQA